MSTGRMPAKEVGAENERKPTLFTERQIRDIAEYVASLGGGPPIPAPEQVDPRLGDPAVGSELFSANCAQCHGFAGAGGALTYGKDAPPLTASQQQKVTAQALKFVACMRAHGLPNFPDPVNAEGRVEFMLSASQDGFDPHSPQVLAKAHQCESVLPPGSGLPSVEVTS